MRVTVRNKRKFKDTETGNYYRLDLVRNFSYLRLFLKITLLFSAKFYYFVGFSINS